MFCFKIGQFKCIYIYIYIHIAFHFVKQNTIWLYIYKCPMNLIFVMQILQDQQFRSFALAREWKPQGEYGQT